MIDADTAFKQADALLVAGERSPIRQYAYELRRRGREWRTAYEMAKDTDELLIELAGSVVPGMMVPGLDGSRMVLRTLHRDGQFTLHVENDTGYPTYLNYVGPSSPVVVLP